MDSTSHALERGERLRRPRVSLLRVTTILQLVLLQIRDGVCIDVTARKFAYLQCAAVKARAIIIEAFADDLPAPDNNTPKTVIKRRFGGLLQTERKIIVSLHVDDDW